MKTLGWIIIILEIIGYSFRGSWTTEPLTMPKVIVDSAFLISGASLIIADRIFPKRVNK